MFHRMLMARPNSSRALVLIVDDSEDMRRYLRFLLELDSYQVETASSGAEALEQISQGCSPAVVLLDLQMPGMDGMQTLQLLKKLRPELKVIMCSGVDDPGVSRRASLLGAQTYLVKPVQHLYLSAAVEQCLKEKGDESSTIEPIGSTVITLPSPSRYEEKEN